MDSHLDFNSARRPGALLALALIAACAPGDRTPTAPSSAKLVLDGAAPAAGLAAVRLTVTVNDSGPSGSYKIRSDELGAYVDGQQKMMAQIDAFGNLQISPNNLNSKTPPQRTLRFDYSAPVDPKNTFRPNESSQWNFKIKSNKINNGNPPIQNLGITGNPASGCYNVTIAHATTPTIQYEDDFNVAAYPQATYVYITRTNPGGSPATWTMVSDGPCLVNSNAAYLAGHGYYDQQLSIQLTALP